MKHYILAALAALAVSACTPPTPQLDPSGNPVPQASGASSWLAPFMGSMAGSVVGNALKAPTSPAPSFKAPSYSYRPATGSSRSYSYSSGRR